MCGIAGIFNLDGQGASSALLRKMTDSISHRGPDGEGFYVDRFVSLGHRRLAIIDLTPSGHQPMVTADGLYAITYNGEIYNFQELRQELESLGHSFASRTDSEVALKAYVQWGGECVKRFNGMFAFAIWDKTRQELFLARDRYGIKPLYYTFRENTFIFASEQKAIVVHPGVKKELDEEALYEYFTFQNIFTDKTLLKGINILPAGSYARITLGSGKGCLDPVLYWDFNFMEPERPMREEEYVEELLRLFRQAVSRQLVSDVDIGSYLSGGMDSGSIAAVAASILPYMKTFTCGFDLNSATGLELGFDEREKAEYMSYLLKTEHYEVILKAGDMERVMPKLAWHMEEPRVGQSYPNFYIARLASKFVKVTLSGAGGDELFGGYPWRYYRAAVNNDFDHYIEKYYAFWQRLIPNGAIDSVFRPIQDKVKHIDTKEIFRNVFHEHSEKFTRPEDYINHSLYFEAKTFLHGLLVVEDKLSMAHGLETRVPFLDNDLVDFAMRVPVRLKLNNLSEIVKLNENEPGPKSEKYFQRTKDGKQILRKIMGRYIPEEITTGIKQGFSAPDATWFRGESIDYIRSRVCDRNNKIFEYLDFDSVKGLVDMHLEGKQNMRLFIWSLLSVKKWCDVYLV